jgi:hypothetical protein
MRAADFSVWRIDAEGAVCVRKFKPSRAGTGNDSHTAEGAIDNLLDDFGSKKVSIQPGHLIEAVKGPAPVLSSQFNAHERLFDAGKKPFYAPGNTFRVGDGQIERVARHGDEPPGCALPDA